MWSNIIRSLVVIRADALKRFSFVFGLAFLVYDSLLHSLRIVSDPRIERQKLYYLDYILLIYLRFV